MRYFHATPFDLRAETDLLPPSVTGRAPHWDDMDPAELDEVFVCDSLDAARGWGAEIAGQYGRSFFVFEVAPERPRPGAHGTYAAARARILALVFAWDAATETATIVDA